MNMRVGPEWLKGSFTPLVTPYRNGAVDYERYARLVAFQIAGGSHGIVVTGTTGEPTNLSVEERAELVRVAVATADGRIPVIAATGAFRPQESIALTRLATEAGADAVMIVAPGFVKPSDEGMVAYFTEVLSETHLPALLYNIPGRAMVTIGVDVVCRVADAIPHLVGLKTASADLEYITALLARLGPDFRIFCGLESYTWPMMAIGAAGVTSAVGNLLPKPVADLCNMALAGDMAGARALHYALFEVNKAIFFDTNPVPLKAMMAQWGLCSPEVRSPLAPASEALNARLSGILQAYSRPVAA